MDNIRSDGSDDTTPTTIKYEVNGDPLENSGQGSGDGSTSVHTHTLDVSSDNMSPTTHSIVHLSIPTEVQTVIQQPNQQSVIQTATNVQLSKSNVILVSGSKSNSVIQTPQGSLQAVQVDYVVDSSDDSMSDELEDGIPKKRRDILSRRPSYRKILNDLGGGEIAVIPAGTILSSPSDGSIHTLNINTGAGGNTLLQYQGADGQFFVPGGPIVPEDQARKREMRLMKNREAARECRRKKKEYIKCLENRVAVLENQNKALIDELKSLKELYCRQKIE